MSIFSTNRDYQAHIDMGTLNRLLSASLADRLDWYKQAKVKSLFKDRINVFNHMYYCYMLD